MAGFVSEGTKDVYEAVFNKLHDTFKRTVKAYKEGKKIVMSSDPNYNHVYDNIGPNVVIEKIEKEFLARIYYYPKSQEKKGPNITSEDSLTIPVSEGDVRLKITKEDYDFMKDAERVMFDGETFRIASQPRPHSLFQRDQFRTIILKRLD